MFSHKHLATAILTLSAFNAYHGYADAIEGSLAGGQESSQQSGFSVNSDETQLSGATAHTTGLKIELSPGAGEESVQLNAPVNASTRASASAALSADTTANPSANPASPGGALINTAGYSAETWTQSLTSLQQKTTAAVGSEKIVPPANDNQSGNGEKAVTETDAFVARPSLEIAPAVESSMANELTTRAATSVTGAVNNAVEASVANAVTQSVTSTVDTTVNEAIESTVDSNIRQSVSQSIQGAF